MISAEPFFNKESFLNEKIEFEISKKKEKKKKDAEKKKDDKEDDERSMKANSKRLNLVNNMVHVGLYKLKNKELHRYILNKYSCKNSMKLQCIKFQTNGQ